MNLRPLLPLVIGLGSAGAGPMDFGGSPESVALRSSSRLPSAASETIFCTPDSISVPGRDFEYVDNPIAAALRVAEPGSHIQLSSGDYPPFTIGMGSRSSANADTRGGRRGEPIVIEGGSQVRIVGKFDTIAINYNVPVGYITFRNLTILPGTRAGVIFYKHAGAVYRGFSFEDCHILGQFNHLTGQGTSSKWGVKANNLADFRFVGKFAPARIENIAVEHAFYLQNHRGPILIEEVHAKNLGRTFVQFTARAAEGPPGKGNITIRRCQVEDACIGRGDAFKGGSAFTFSGRLDCRILLEKNTYRAGFASGIQRLTRKGQPYGTGALAAWTEGTQERNGELVLQDNQFSMAEGCGDRALVSIGGCKKVNIVGSNRFRAGGDYEALALDPVRNTGQSISPANRAMFVASQTEIIGGVTIAGELVGAERMAQLARRGP